MAKDQIVQIGRIVLADESQDRTTTGRIVAIGPDCVGGLKVGDRVLYQPYAGTKCIIDGKTEEPVIIVDEERVQAIIGADANVALG